MTNSIFPPILKNTKIDENPLGASELVIFKLKCFTSASMGHYYYSNDSWLAVGVSEPYKTCDVSEWWYTPESGTGNKLEVNKDELNQQNLLLD
jgi:hypothetical protein